MLMAFPVSVVSACNRIVPWGHRTLASSRRSTSELAEQPFTASAMGDSMDSDLLPEQFGEKWVPTTHLDEATGDLPQSDSDPDLIASSLMDKTFDHCEGVGTGRCTSDLVGLCGIISGA